MKEKILSFLIFLCSSNISNAQSPKIAVVRPDGTTYICPTWDSAYKKAANDDNIYLPGGTFLVTNMIGKRLNIYGAGFNEDSSRATGITKMNPITFLAGSEYGSIEGIAFNTTSCIESSITFGLPSYLNPISNFTISNCFLSSGINFTSPCTNILIKNNYIGGYNCNNGGAKTSFGEKLSNSLISNNIITGGFNVIDAANLQINNNIFFFAQDFYYLPLANNSSYNNNITLSGTSTVANSNFNNNANVSPNGSGNLIFNHVYESFDSSFVNPGPNSSGKYYYDSHNNYHIRPSSLCKNSGTDGTDRGIYGGTYPWKDGSAPSNPHIYFKQIAPQSNNNGLLQVQFKVRTGN